MLSYSMMLCGTDMDHTERQQSGQRVKYLYRYVKLPIPMVSIGIHTYLTFGIYES